MSDDLLKRRVEARRLIRARDHAALATSLDGWPYVSLVATACDIDASPLLLLSDLAQHTRNLAAEPACLAAVRGDRRPCRPARRAAADACSGAPSASTIRACAARFAARHPASAVYAGFADFHLYRVAIERGHLVAGFGRIAWIEGEQPAVCRGHLGARRGRAGYRRAYERRPRRCRAALCQNSARARRRGLADDRHRPGGPGSAAPSGARPPGSISPNRC